MQVGDIIEVKRAVRKLKKGDKGILTRITPHNNDASIQILTGECAGNSYFYDPYYFRLSTNEEENMRLKLEL